MTALYHSELATGFREADLELDPADLSGVRPQPSYLRDEDRWTPYCDRSWTVDAPTQFSGEARGPPKKEPPKR